MIRLPVHMGDVLNRVERIRDAIEATTGKPARAFDIATSLSIPVKKVEQLLRASVEIISINSELEVAGASITISEALVDPSLGPEEQEMSLNLGRVIEKLLMTIDAKEANVLRLRFGINVEHNVQTLDEIGQTLGITRERVRQIEAAALKKLRLPSRLKILAGYGDHNQIQKSIKIDEQSDVEKHSNY